MDVNYKHLAKSGEKELLLVTWDSEQNSGKQSLSTRGDLVLKLTYYLAVVLARAFLSNETSEMFHHFFRTYFELLQQVAGYSLRLKYHHGDGLLGVTMDQDHGQVLGKYFARGC